MTDSADINRIFTAHRRRYLYEVWIPRIGAVVVAGAYLWCCYYALITWAGDK